MPPTPPRDDFWSDDFRRTVRHLAIQGLLTFPLGAAFAWWRTRSPAWSAFEGAVVATCTSASIVAFLVVARLVWLRTHTERAGAATASQRREHRIAVALGLALLVGTVVVLYRFFP